MSIVTAAVRDVDNKSPRDSVTEELIRAWREAGELAAAYPAPQDHPRIGAWREALRQAGISPRKFPCSAEAMVRRAYKGGEPFSLNPLADYIHAVSLRHLVPVGGFDLDGMAGNFELRTTRAGDRFTALGEENQIDLPAGELAYASGGEVLTRHVVWRQSRHALLAEGTRAAVLVAEILPEAAAQGAADAVKGALADGLERWFGVRPHLAVVDEDHPRIPLDRP
jgi:DNA/RNA-binding domain of Phe-tRNA-synthetase-like protein